MSEPVFRATGRLEQLDAGSRRALFERGRARDPQVRAVVAGVIDDVRAHGDAALHALAARFDGTLALRIEVPRREWLRALDALDPAVRDALGFAAQAIGAFHRAQLPAPLEIETTPGVRLGRRSEALERVGVYAPGGRASYPSSVLMGVVPARVAGVGEVVVCSPPGESGAPPAAVLAACAIAGADRVFALGGAGAIAAMAYGTESVPRVSKVVGPGNAYVTEAKRQLSGEVATDAPAGPSELLIIADERADASLIAVELLAQAEHDPDAAVLLVTTSAAQPAAVHAALTRLLADHPRRAIAMSALAGRGALLVAASLDEALAFAAEWAPEHLLLMVADPRAALERVRHAGTTFLGAASSVAFGDYVTGANHVLPTAGLAHAYSGLSTADFLRTSTWQEVTPFAATMLAEYAAVLAEAEGLPAHALAARMRSATAGLAVDELPQRPMQEVSAIRTRTAYRDLRPYEPGRIPVPLDLSDNTNLCGVPPAAAAVLSALPASTVTRYPSVYATQLKDAFARHFAVSPANVTTGAGSDDVIDSAVRAFCEPGDTLAFPVPTFGVVPDFARMNAVVPVPVPLGPEFALDATALLATGATAIYLCRPNNPTGTHFERDAVEHILRDARGVVLIDEAYADFADDDLLHAAVDSGRAIVLRTLSKAWGLAGLRIGCAVGPARLIAEVEKSRGPYKVSGVAEAAAVAALREDREWVERAVAEVRDCRERLTAALTSRGFRVWPSAANFLLVGARQAGARALSKALLEQGVQVRAFPNLPQAGDAIRVGLGPWPLMARFLDALDASGEGA